MPVESYTILGTGTLASGYTPGTGKMIFNGGHSFPARGLFSIAFATGGGVITAVYTVMYVYPDLNTFAVAFEAGTDGSQSPGATGTEVLGQRGLDQIRADINQVGPYANLPDASTQKNGNRYKCTDSPYELIMVNGAWAAFVHGAGPQVTIPPSTGWITDNVTPPLSIFDWQGGPMWVRCTTAQATAMRVWYQPAPTTPYIIRALFVQPDIAFVGSQTGTQSGFGLAIGDSSGKWITWYFVDTNGSYIMVADKWTNTTTYSGASYSSTQYGSVSNAIFSVIRQYRWIQIMDDGAGLKFGLSVDGIHFDPMIPSTFLSRTDFLSAGPSRIGIMIYPTNVSTTMTLLSWQIIPLPTIAHFDPVMAGGGHDRRRRRGQENSGESLYV